MSSPDPSYDSFAFDPDDDQWNPYDDSSQRQTQTNEETNELKFCQLSNWESKKTYDDSYIHYTIEWKMTVNNRAIMPKDTLQDMVLAPADSWKHVLKTKLEESVQQQNRSLELNFISVVVSVTQRKEPPLSKVFPKTSIDWAVIESQLVAWSKFYRAGKKLKLNLSFDYVDATNTSLRRGDKRGHSSTTRQMLATGALQADAEQHSSRQSLVWRHVYKTMRCAGSPCEKGPHCWVDPVGKKHYKLYTPHLTDIVEYVQNGHKLETHDDVPKDIREQLYAEERQALERHKKATRTSAASLPPINITMLPAPSHQTSNVVSSPAGTTALDIPSKSTPIVHLDIPGFLDVQVEEYCAWQESRFKRPSLKVEYKKACDVIIGDAMDLGLIRQDPNPDFLTEKGVLLGVAKHIVGDIDYWVKNVKRARTEEQLD